MAKGKKNELKTNHTSKFVTIIYYIFIVVYIYISYFTGDVFNVFDSIFVVLAVLLQNSEYIMKKKTSDIYVQLINTSKKILPVILLILT